MKKIIFSLLFAISLGAYSQGGSFAPLTRDSVAKWGARANALHLTFDNYMLGELFLNNAGSGLGPGADTSYWKLGGNTLAGDRKFGVTNGHDVIFTSLNFERARLKANGHWQFTSNMYDSGDGKFLDFGDHSIYFNNTVKILDGGTFQLFGTESPQNISLDFAARKIYDNAGTNLIDYNLSFTKFHGTSVADIWAFDGEDMEIGTDAAGTAGKGLYLKAMDVTGGQWRTGLKYLNQSNATYPTLFLQPNGGRTQIGGNGIYSTDTVVIDVSGRTANSSNGRATFGFENGTVYAPSGALRFDANNATINMGSDVRINFNSGFIYYQNTNVFADWGNARFYQSNGKTKVFDFYSGPLQIFPSGGQTVFGAASCDASSIVEITSTTQLFRVTPMTAVQASAITPAEGSVVVVSTTNGTFTAVGMWLYIGGAWTQL